MTNAPPSGVVDSRRPSSRVHRWSVCRAWLAGTNRQGLPDGWLLDGFHDPGHLPSATSFGDATAVRFSEGMGLGATRDSHRAGVPSAE